MQVELRVIWNEQRAPGQPPVKCWRRVADSEEAARRMNELRAAGALEVDCLTSAAPCTCPGAAVRARDTARRSGESAAAKELRSRPLYRYAWGPRFRVPGPPLLDRKGQTVPADRAGAR